MFRIPRRREIPRGFIGSWIAWHAMSYMRWLEEAKEVKGGEPISEYKLSKKLRIDKKTLRNSLDPLIERGFVERIVTERPSALSRKGRDYRLTDSGKEWAMRFGSAMRDLFP